MIDSLTSEFRTETDAWNRLKCCTWNILCSIWSIRQAFTPCCSSGIKSFSLQMQEMVLYLVLGLVLYLWVHIKRIFRNLYILSFAEVGVHWVRSTLNNLTLTETILCDVNNYGTST